MAKTISQLDELSTSSITNTGNVWFGVDNSGDGTSYKLPLSSLQQFPGEVVDVRSYGATGDGVTVDSAAILSAIAAAPSGGAVLFPAGTYVCTSSWVAPSIAKDLTFIGDEGALIIGPTAAGTDNNFVNLTEGYNLNLIGLKFRQFHGVVQLEANTTTQHETLRVYRCDFDGPYYAVYDAGGAGQNNVIERFEFVGNRVHDTTRAPKRGVVVRFVDHKHVVVRDNYFVGISNNDIAAAVWIGSASTTGGESCEVSGNFIDGVTCSNNDQDVHGIFLYSAVCHVDGNTIKNISNLNNGENSEGIYVKSACPVISGNYLEDAGSEAFIYFKGALSSVEKGGVISGNTCRLVSGTLAEIGGRGGFGISTVNPCTITGNDIDGLLGGIYVTTVDGASVTGNSIHNILGTNETMQGIYIEDSSNVTVSGNVINDIRSLASGPCYGIRIRRSVSSTSRHIHVSGNVITTLTTGSGGEAGIALQGDTADEIDGVGIIGNYIEGCDQGIFVIAGGANINNVVIQGNVFDNCAANIHSSVATLASVKYGDYASGSGSPSGSVTPDYVSQKYLDTSNNSWYTAVGSGNVNWHTSAQVGSCLVVHADGSYDIFNPVADTRNSRGAALSSALAALVTRTAADLPGSTLYLYPGADYEAVDLTVTSKHGVRIIGQSNVIWNTPSTAYDHILRFTTCDDVHLEGITVQGDGDLSNPADPASVTNTGSGVGIYFHTCARPRVINCGAHGMTGNAKAPYPYNGEANGLYFVTCTDVYVDGFESNYAGCYGLATIGSSSRVEIKNCLIYNARARSMQLTPGAANPYIHVTDCTLMSDETVNTLSTDTDWFSYIPMIDVGNTGALVDTVTLSNVNFYWLNPSASATASGSGFPLLKIQDVTNCRMNNCTLWHGNAFSAGTGSPYTLSVITQNSSGPLYIEMNNCYLSMDFTTTSYLGSYQPNHLRATGCHFNADIASSLTFYNFHGTMIVRDCTFSNFNNGVFDLNRDSSGYLEVVGCTFNGTGTTNNVFYAGGSGWNANAIGAWAGDYLVCNNIYNNCRVAAAAADRMVLNTATGDRNEIVWDDSLAGDHVHPAPGTSPGVFASVSGQAGMKIKNKNYSPNATSTWAAEYAWWSTSTGSWQDS